MIGKGFQYLLIIANVAFLFRRHCGAVFFSSLAQYTQLGGMRGSATCMGGRQRSLHDALQISLHYQGGLILEGSFEGWGGGLLSANAIVQSV